MIELCFFIYQMARNERFPSSFQFHIQTLVQTLTSHITQKSKEAPEETKSANQSLANFVKVSTLQVCLLSQDVKLSLYSTATRIPARFGVSRWSRPLTRRFCVTYTNMLVSKKACVPNATPYLPNAIPSLPNATPYLPNATPNANQWNKVCVGYARVGFALGM